MFPVQMVPPESALTTEPLGTKYKFWFNDENHGLTLFKEGRPGTGENWAEKIACELAQTLELPHAFYDLARYGTREGIVSRSLVTKGARVVHGNELLAASNTDYIQGESNKYRNPSHTLRRVIAYLKASDELVGAPYGWRQFEQIQNALDFFTGYLLFDLWIANQDRHDENWGILRMDDGNTFLAPSYDHGSSMARNETDNRRRIRLTTKDPMQHISSFVLKARSGFFPNAVETSPTPISTLEAFSQIAVHAPRAAVAWREKLDAIDRNQVQTIIDQVPPEWMSDTARDFTVELLRLNKQRILDIELK